MQRKQCPRCGRYLKASSKVHWPCVLARVRQVTLLPALVLLAVVIAGFLLLSQDGEEARTSSDDKATESADITATLTPSATQTSPTPDTTPTETLSPTETLAPTTPAPTETLRTVQVLYALIPLHPEATFSDEIVGWAAQGALLEVVSLQGDWYQIRLDDEDSLGWVWGRYVRLEGEE